MEVGEVMYVYDYVPSAEVSKEHDRGKTCKSGVGLMVDQQGCMTPTATGVMLVKDIAGKACSRVL